MRLSQRAAGSLLRHVALVPLGSVVWKKHKKVPVAITAWTLAWKIVWKELRLGKERDMIYQWAWAGQADSGRRKRRGRNGTLAGPF